MNRRVFMKSGAMALVTMGLSPSFLRRTAFGAELLSGAATEARARQDADLSLPARRGGCAQRRRAARRGGVLHAAAEHRDPAADAPPGSAGAIDLDGFFGLHPSLAPIKPLWDRGHPRAGARRGQSEQHALALRRAGLHGDRHARPQGHARRVAQSLPRRARAPARRDARTTREAVAVPRRGDDAADAAHPRGTGSRRSR